MDRENPGEDEKGKERGGGPVRVAVSDRRFQKNDKKPYQKTGIDDWTSKDGGLAADAMGPKK